MEESSNDGAKAEFLVLGDGRQLWHSGVVTKSSQLKPVEIDIAGVQMLVLKTTIPENARHRERIVWNKPIVSVPAQ